MKNQKAAKVIGQLEELFKVIKEKAISDSDIDIRRIAEVGESIASGYVVSDKEK